MRLVTLLAAGFLALSGCSQWDAIDWQRLSTSVERMTEMGARLAFLNPDVAAHQEQICFAVERVATGLGTFEDPDATFEKIRTKAHEIVNAIPSEQLPDNLKPIVLLVVDQGLDAAFAYVREAYEDMLNQERTQVVLLVAKAAASGLLNACSPEPQYLKK